MITHHAAERVAAAVNQLRPDWPAASILTLIERDLTLWALTDLVVALGYIAVDQNSDGSWASRTPARVKEDGPWRTVGIAHSDDFAARERAARELEERRRDNRVRRAAVDGCRLCDSDGYTITGVVCTHDDSGAARAKAGADRARQALQSSRSATMVTIETAGADS